MRWLPILLLLSACGGTPDTAADPATDAVAAKAVADVDAATATASAAATREADAQPLPASPPAP